MSVSRSRIRPARRKRHNACNADLDCFFQCELKRADADKGQAKNEFDRIGLRLPGFRYSRNGFMLADRFHDRAPDISLAVEDFDRLANPRARDLEMTMFFATDVNEIVPDRGF